MAKHRQPQPGSTSLWLRLVVFAAVVAVALVTEDAKIVGTVAALALVVLGWDVGRLLRDRDPPGQT